MPGNLTGGMAAPPPDAVPTPNGGICTLTRRDPCAKLAAPLPCRQLRNMTRAFNFSPGPAVLPESVLRQAAAEMLDWHGSGISVMEMSHRGKEFMSIAAQARADLA